MVNVMSCEYSRKLADHLYKDNIIRRSISIKMGCPWMHACSYHHLNMHKAKVQLTYLNSVFIIEIIRFSQYRIPHTVALKDAWGN